MQPSPTLDPVRPATRRVLWIVLAVTALLRTLTAGFGPDHFNDDRDAYLVLAQGLAEGRGFSVPGTTRPTAYRPPLYPLLLTPVSGTDEFGKVGRAAGHVVLSVCMVWLAWTAGTSIGLSLKGKLLTAGLLVFDPLLVMYANFPMTETLCACLGAWLIHRLLMRDSSWPGAFLTGVVFGLCVLSRPTFWAAGGLFVLAFGLKVWQAKLSGREVVRTITATGLGVAICVVPWGMRNWMLLGHPVLMTTHGGYTALLGNNDEFYNQVTSQSWSTLWEGAGQQQWADRVNQELDRQGILHEVDRDQWMNARAKETIKRRPHLFIKATCSRVLQFWNVLAGGDSSREFSRLVLYGGAVFYGVYWLASLRGLWCVLRERMWHSLPLLLLPLGFMCVHAVYWSNIRMRAPVLPAVALLAAWGTEQRREKYVS